MKITSKEIKTIQLSNRFSIEINYTTDFVENKFLVGYYCDNETFTKKFIAKISPNDFEKLGLCMYLLPFVADEEKVVKYFLQIVADNKENFVI